MSIKYSYFGDYNSYLSNVLQNFDSFSRNPMCITPQEYFDASFDLLGRDIGRPIEQTTKMQKFKAQMWLCEEFPLSLPEQVIPIIDLMATSNAHFRKLKDFITLQLPSGFPVKIGRYNIISVSNLKGDLFKKLCFFTFTKEKASRFSFRPVFPSKYVVTILFECLVLKEIYWKMYVYIYKKEGIIARTRRLRFEECSIGQWSILVFTNWPSRSGEYSFAEVSLFPFSTLFLWFEIFFPIRLKKRIGHAIYFPIFS